MSLAALARRLRAGELTPLEAVDRALDGIGARDGAFNAFISVRGEEARDEALALARIPAGRRGPLHGVPVAVKDVIDVAGTRTTANSAVFDDRPAAERDAAVVSGLRTAGAVIVGKLNTHEMAYGAFTTSQRFGAARNPWDPGRICGGSSGGSGAAAAADLVPGNLGTDTAGSIRIPAAACGVTGLRPTVGRVSNRGVVPVAWTFDTVGPLARSAEDCALLLAAVAGRDPGDPSTSVAPVDPYVEALGAGAGGLRVGVVDALVDRADGRVGALVRGAAEDLRRAGARVEGVEVPMLDRLGPVQQAIQFPEAAAAHLRWLRERPERYGADVRARLLTGLLVPPTTYLTGLRARRLALAAADELLARFDVLLAPTLPGAAPRRGEEEFEIDGVRVDYRAEVIAFNSPWSCLGLPAVSVPCGFVDGMPAGMTLTGRRFAEATVLRAAHAFQRETDWHTRRPPGA